MLDRVADGDSVAEGELYTRLYEELKSQADVYMRRQPAGHTLQATALVHEAYTRLFRGADTRWANRGHFLAFAAKAMRSVLVDHARGKNRARRGTPKQMTMNHIEADLKKQGIEIVDLDDVLSRFAEKDPRGAQIVELRFFGGLTMDEIASVLDVPKRSVERDWLSARVWLGRELR